MGGMSVWVFESGTIFFVVFGLLIGILFGFFGLGGSFFVTPALLVLGHPAKAAVGSGLVFVFGTSIAAVVTHRGLGHIDYKLGLLLVLGMTTGIEVGKRLLFALATVGVANFAISVMYVGLLTAVGLYTLHDVRTVGSEVASDANTSLIRQISTFPAPPMMTFKGGISASASVIIVLSFITGILAGVLGVGGGFLVLPGLMYGLALPEAVAVGTDIFQIAISSGYGAFLYARADAVHLTVVIPLLGGSIFGAYVGSHLTEYVDATKFKQYFAMMLLIDSVAVMSKIVSHTYGIVALHVLSLVLLFGTALIVSLVVVFLGTRNFLRHKHQPLGDS
ncbi:sulfite exporter TauE/SafE family protein [Haladaptatus salinisoli]|uniref:sulfite exporter TauE/SafE family protein n=1 Tax=Haladaptatus salinisoli TaxID=2884876 RepID=UPI001D0B3E7D|nr:sulfite exporter TauE/SafE family protein [Haladaptatus salinisoli]